MLSPLTGTLGPLGRGRAAAAGLTETANLLQWLEADSGVYQTSGGSAATSDGHSVGEWQDKSGNAEHASALTTARPTLRLAVASLNSQAALEFDGSSDTMTVTLSSTSGAYTVYFVVKPDDSGAAVRYLLDIETGRLLLIHSHNGGTGQPGYFDGAFHVAGTPTTAAQILTYAVGSSTGQVYRNGTQIVTDTYTAKNLGGSQRLGSRFSADSNFYDGLMAAVLVYTVKHDSTQRLTVHTYLSNKYGITI